MQKTYFIKTFGCQMNEADSEKITAFLEQKGYRPTEDKYKADLVVINTCSVRESAENRVFGLINNIKKQRTKSKNTNKKLKIKKLETGGWKLRTIIITGCMVGSGIGKRKRYTLKQLKKKLPGVEFIPLKKLLKGFKGKPKYKKKKTALVPIMEGCNNFCSYCVVPYAKGREISRPFEEIVCEIKNLVKNGYEEVMLLGQNVNSYGKGGMKSSDRKNATLRASHFAKASRDRLNFSENTEETPFAKLLRRLHKIKGLKKIKFMTSNPWDLTNDIIKALKLPKVDRYLHLPVQSGDDKILNRMNRRYTVKEYLALVKKIRKEIPNIEIGTDIIVGFPGETKKQFKNTVKLCKKVGFKVAYIAKYSPRQGTAAFKSKDNITMEEKKRRWRVLNQIINRT